MRVLEIDEIFYVGCGDLVGGGGGFYRLDERNLERGWWVGVGIYKDGRILDLKML